MTPEELVHDVCPRIGALGPAYYFAPATLERAGELGLDPFRFYLLGRGGVLGDVDASVAHSALGYFNPTMLADLWTSACEVLDPKVAAAEYLECAAAHGRRHLPDVDGLDALCAAAEAVAAAADPMALTLYAAAATFPRATDVPGRTMQLLSLLREYRGSAHLLALRACGVDTKTAHHIRRPNDVALFGWAPGDAPVITDADRRGMELAEQMTDQIVTPAFAALDQAGAEALARGLKAVEVALA